MKETFTWGGDIQMVLMLVSVSLPLLNMFPYFVYKFGGFAYMLIFAIFIIFFGVPFMFVQVIDFKLLADLMVFID